MRLDEIQVSKACLPVVEDVTYYVSDLASFEVIGSRHPPSHHHELGVESVDGLPDWSGDGLFGFIFKEFDVRIWFPLSEVFLDRGDECVRVEVSGDADGHVVRYVEVGSVVLYVDD